jgi:hypothetical protein
MKEVRGWLAGGVRLRERRGSGGNGNRLNLKWIVARDLVVLDGGDRRRPAGGFLQAGTVSSLLRRPPLASLSSRLLTPGAKAVTRMVGAMAGPLLFR